MTRRASGEGRVSSESLTRKFSGSPIGSRSSVVRWPANCITRSFRADKPEVSRSYQKKVLFMLIIIAYL